jgi:hypothetical protein
MGDYPHALDALYKAPLADFIAERKRLADELRAAGDRDGATQLARRRRPTTSAWTVNQLYWKARDAFDALLAAAARVRKGDLRETRAYREALGELRKRAATVLRDAAHAPTEATLRRVMGTLAAVAAAGGFDPDPPGALAADREPPGFEAVDMTASTSEHQPYDSSRHRAAVPGRAHLSAALAEQRAHEQTERTAREGERRRLREMLREARAAVRAREHASALLQKQLDVSEKAAEDARRVVLDLERQLEVLDDAD